jgi:hypothetical protein
MGTSRNQRTLLGLLAGLCVLALVLGDLTRAVHLLTARHVVCAAHGELIEAGEYGISPAVPRGDREVGVVGSRGASVEDHEHCSAAAAPSRPLATNPIGAMLTALEMPAETVVPCFTAPSPHARPALEFAPKQGPPV